VSARFQCLIVGLCCVSLTSCFDPPIDVNAQYRVRGSVMMAQKQAVSVLKNGQNVTGLTVSVNDQVLPQLPTGIAYVGSLVAPVPEGGRIDLKVVVPEGTITANDTVPFAPTISQLASRSISQAIELRWSIVQEPDEFFLFAAAFNSAGVTTGGIMLSDAGQSLPYVPGTVRSVILPAGTFPTGTDIARIDVGVLAINDGKGTFKGPNLNLQDSTMQLQGKSATVSFVPTP
jgi:hypothetical protein